MKWNDEKIGFLIECFKEHGNKYHDVVKEFETKYGDITTYDAIETKARRLRLKPMELFFKETDKKEKKTQIADYPERIVREGVKGNVLVIGDTHIPFERKGYLDFCQRTRDKYDCKHIVHIGDLIDNHGINFHQHNPDGYSAGEEVDIAIERLRSWIKAFPKMNLTIGNHDALTIRQAQKSGVPKRMIPHLNSIWGLPEEWVWSWKLSLNGVMYKHGTSCSGLYPHANQARANTQSVVMGHTHSVGGVHYLSSEEKLFFGLATGCGIDTKTYVIEYARELPRRPIIGCGVVLDNGHKAQFVPMDLR